MVFKKGNKIRLGVVLSKDTIEKMSKSHKGLKYKWSKPMSEEGRKNISIAKRGKASWNKGIPCREETKRKLREIKKRNWQLKSEKERKAHAEKIKISMNKIEVKNKLRQKKIGTKASLETKDKMSKSHKGHIVTIETREKIRNGNIDWDFYNKHGTTKHRFPYDNKFDYNYKEYIRDLWADENGIRRCVVTGMTEEEHVRLFGCKLHVHHIDHNKQNTSLENNVPIIQSINTCAENHIDRLFWEQTFYDIVKYSKQKGLFNSIL